MSNKKDLENIQRLETAISEIKEEFRCMLEQSNQTLPQFFKSKFGFDITLEKPILMCPIATSYFLKFLQTEFNAENLFALIEFRQFMTYANQTREEGNDFSKEIVSKTMGKLKRAINTYIDDSAKMEVNLPSVSKKKASNLSFKLNF